MNLKSVPSFLVLAIMLVVVTWLRLHNSSRDCYNVSKVGGLGAGDWWGLVRRLHRANKFGGVGRRADDKGPCLRYPPTGRSPDITNW